MAESDRPEPESQPGDAPPPEAVAEGGQADQVFMADGTPVGDESRSANPEEMDELLDLFREEMEAAPPDSTERLSAQEAEEEELIRQAEALLGTTDPHELEHLAELHRAEAADHLKRLTQQQQETPAAPPPAPPAGPRTAADVLPLGAHVQPGPRLREVRMVEPPVEGPAPLSAADVPPLSDLVRQRAADPPVPEEPAAEPVRATPPPAIPEIPEVRLDEAEDLDEFLASVGVDTTSAAPTSAPPPEAPPESAPPLPETADAPAEPEPEPEVAVEAAVDPTSVEVVAPSSQPEAVDDELDDILASLVPSEPAKSAEVPSTPAEAASKAPAKSTPASTAKPPAAVSDVAPEAEAEVEDEAPELVGAGVTESRIGFLAFRAAKLVRSGMARGSGLAVGVLRRLRPAPREEPDSVPTLGWLQRVATSKGKLAIGAGVTASLAAAVGFALFDLQFGAQLLARRFPDATTPRDLQYYQAVAYLQRGEYVRVRQLLRPLAVAGQPREADIEFVLAEAYFLDELAPDNFRFARARDHYVGAIAADPVHPRNVVARRRIAESYRAQRLWPEAGRAYRLLLDRYQHTGDAADAHYALGEVAQADGRLADAAEAFERVWNEFPEAPLAPAARLRHGDVLRELGRIEDADHMWRELAHTRTAPTVRWAAIARLADLSESRNELEEARDWWEVWLRGAPDATEQPAAWLRYAGLVERVGDPAAMARSLEFVLQTYPASPEAIEAALKRGATLRRDDDTQGARDMYADALVHAPENPRLLTAMSQAYLDEGNMERGVDYAERAVAAAPTSSAQRLHLATAYMTAAQPKNAARMYWDLLARYPIADETPIALNRLVALLREQDMQVEAYRAVTFYSTVAAGGQATGAVAEAKATLLAGMGLWDEVQEELGVALEATPSDRLRLELADAQVRTRDWSGMLATLDAMQPAALHTADYTRYATLRATALLRTGQPDALPRVLEAATQRLGTLPLTLQGIEAQALMALGDTSKARAMIAAFDAAGDGETPPPADLADTYLAWAQHLFDGAIYSRAAQYFARVQGDAYNPHDQAWAAYQRGNCFTQLRDYSQAVAAYEGMIAGYPRAPWVPFAREKAQFAQLQVDAADQGNRI